MSITVYPIKVSSVFSKNYTYIIVNELEGSGIIVDPSWEPEKVVKILDDKEITLLAILLTHHHFDHVNLHETLFEKDQPLVVISQVESDYYNFKYPRAIYAEPDTVIKIGGMDVIPMLTPGHTKLFQFK